MVGFWLLLSLITIITTFGFGTAINMLLRRWWLALTLYVIFILYLGVARFSHITVMEWVILGIGLIGAVLSAWGTRALKKRGYALFL